MFTIDNAPPSIVSPLRWQSVKVHNIHGKNTNLVSYTRWLGVYIRVCSDNTNPRCECAVFNRNLLILVKWIKSQ